MDFLRNISKLTLALASIATVLLLILLAALLSQSGIIQGAFFQQKSPATISTQNNQIVIQSQIASDQKANADQFLETIGLNEELIRNISFGFDQNTINYLNVLMPIKLELQFRSTKELHFSGTIDGNLTSSFSLPSANYQLATGSAKLVYQGGSPTHIQITDPKQVIDFATSSGKLNLSSKLDSAVTNLEKVSTIELDIQNNKISGEILLK